MKNPGSPRTVRVHVVVRTPSCAFGIGHAREGHDCSHDLHSACPEGAGGLSEQPLRFASQSSRRDARFGSCTALYESIAASQLCTIRNCRELCKAPLHKCSRRVARFGVRTEPTAHRCFAAVRTPKLPRALQMIRSSALLRNGACALLRTTVLHCSASRATGFALCSTAARTRLCTASATGR